jgi:hypothetical protein
VLFADAVLTVLAHPTSSPLDEQIPRTALLSTSQYPNNEISVEVRFGRSDGPGLWLAHAVIAIVNIMV